MSHDCCPLPHLLKIKNNVCFSHNHSCPHSYGCVHPWQQFNEHKKNKCFSATGLTCEKPVPPLQPTMSPWGKREEKWTSGGKGKMKEKKKRLWRVGKELYTLTGGKKYKFKQRLSTLRTLSFLGLFFLTLSLVWNCLHQCLEQFQEEYSEASSEILSMYTKFYIYT